ncbi:MAG TPA: DUF6576 domain-containing protein, partial [Longimicrobiales bacterium]|nr:DUF6576 domain-containing protein [Longimicrobiales bacterium]
LKWRDWKRGQGKREFQKKMTQPSASSSGLVGDRMAVSRWKGIRTEALHELNREEVERLMGKIKESGAGSLTTAEREFLDRMARG